MKKYILTVAVLLSLPAFAVKPADKATQDAVQVVATQIADAFNKNDAKLAASVWAEDGRLINPAGVDAQGRDAVQKLAQADLDTILKGTTSTMTVDSIHKLGAEWVWADATHTLANMKMPDGTMGTGKLHLVVLLNHKGGKWQIEEARPYMFMPAPKGAAAMAAPTTPPAKTTASQGPAGH